ncbi:hypothetical protein LJC16_02325 [Bacteroidales bacterium OttesenSCG-928-C19]|nr:hypothetical protein [Bacteroidales bacterium OttesenSCG-928-C19]
MKKTLLLIGFIGALVFSSCDPKKSKEYIAAQQEIETLRTASLERETEMNSLFDTLNEIEENLSMVTSKFQTVEKLKKDDVENSVDTKSNIKNQISEINQILEDNKARLASLSSRLNASNKKQKELHAFVEKLEARIKEQDDQINLLLADLEQKKVIIEGLNKDVQNLEQSNAEKDMMIAQKTLEGNTAYYILGAYKDLKENNILNKEGGFIGIGARKVMSKDIDLSKFTKIDITKISNIQIGAKKAKIVSQHPDGSYEMVTNEDGHVDAIKIKDINEFWKLTKYLIVEIK